MQTQKQGLAAQPSLQKAQTLAQNRYDTAQARRAAGGVVSAGALSDAEAAAVCTVDFRNRLLKAVEYAHGMWRLQAHFRNLIINGPTALGSPVDLGRELKDALPAAARVPATEALMDNLAACLGLGFSTWLPSQNVAMVMGQGPVPSFSPPFVPVGPVVGGSVIPAPGHLLAGAALNAPRMPYFPAAP